MTRARETSCNSDFSQQLTFAHRSLKHASEKIGSMYYAFASCTAYYEFSIERQGDDRKFGRWISVGNATADCAACAGRRMTHKGERLRDQWRE